MALTVSLEQFKDSLDNCLQQIRAGESLVLTEQGQRLAMIEPVRRIPPEYFAAGRAAIQRLAGRGLARLGSGKPALGASIRVDLHHAPLAEAIVEERAEVKA